MGRLSSGAELSDLSPTSLSSRSRGQPFTIFATLSSVIAQHQFSTKVVSFEQCPTAAPLRAPSRWHSVRSSVSRHGHASSSASIL